MIGRIGRILSDVVPLRRHEWKLALFLYGILTLMVAADWVGKLGADALFVKRYGVNEIPKMYEIGWMISPAAPLEVEMNHWIASEDPVTAATYQMSIVRRRIRSTK